MQATFNKICIGSILRLLVVGEHKYLHCVHILPAPLHKSALSLDAVSRLSSFSMTRIKRE